MKEIWFERDESQGRRVISKVKVRSSFSSNFNLSFLFFWKYNLGPRRMGLKIYCFSKWCPTDNIVPPRSWVLYLKLQLILLRHINKKTRIKMKCILISSKNIYITRWCKKIQCFFCSSYKLRKLFCFDSNYILKCKNYIRKT